MRPLRTTVAVLPLVVGLGAGSVLVGCTSGTGPGLGTASTAAPTMEVQTPAGVVTVALDAQLPAAWPADFPVPEAAEPAGAGTLAGAAPTTQIGAFTSPLPPDQVFAFYAEQAGLPVASASSAGTGEEFDGTVRIDGVTAGLVTVVGSAGGATIVAVLGGADATGATEGVDAAGEAGG